MKGVKADGPPVCHPDRPFKSMGLCNPCYQRSWARRNPERVRARKQASRKRCRRPINYVCYDAQGVVIYVGRGDNERITWHRRFTPWWPEVAKIRIRRRASWADSLVLEALLIRRHQPKYNTEGVTK